MTRKQSVSEGFGEFQYVRMKASWYVETVRAWVMPGAAAGAFTKYLGFETWQAIVAALFVAPIVEGLGYVLGRFMWTHGGTAREYQMAMEKDPYKVKQGEYQDEAIRLLRRMVEHAGHPCREQLSKDDWATAPNRRPDER